jgi:urocanate hydratase
MSTNTARTFAAQVAEGIPQDLPERSDRLNPVSTGSESARNALSPAEKELSLRNALRYFPASLHRALASEFAAELEDDGRITMQRYRPHHAMHARPIGEYPAKTPQAAAIMLMIQNKSGSVGGPAPLRARHIRRQRRGLSRIGPNTG